MNSRFQTFAIPVMLAVTALGLWGCGSVPSFSDIEKTAQNASQARNNVGAAAILIAGLREVESPTFDQIEDGVVDLTDVLEDSGSYDLRRALDAAGITLRCHAFKMLVAESDHIDILPVYEPLFCAPPEEDEDPPDFRRGR